MTNTQNTDVNHIAVWWRDYEEHCQRAGVRTVSPKYFLDRMTERWERWGGRFDSQRMTVHGVPLRRRAPEPKPEPAKKETPFAWSATDITAEETDWLWPDVIERGSMTLLSGQPKMGKSQIAQFIASVVSQGGQWPTGEHAVAGNVLVIDYEDTRSTIKARMEASGADLSRVRILGKGDQILDLSQRDGDMRRLADFAKNVGGLALLSISPGLTLFGQTNHDEVAVRAKIAPLLDWAANTGTAVVFILHPPKNPKADVTAQFAGSDTYRRAARGAWVVMTDPDDKHPNVKLRRRVMLCAGVNNGRDDLELRYRITDAQTPDGVRTSRIKWLSDEEVYGGGVADADDFPPVFDVSPIGEREAVEEEYDELPRRTLKADTSSAKGTRQQVKNIILKGLFKGEKETPELKQVVQDAGYRSNETFYAALNELEAEGMIFKKKSGKKGGAMVWGLYDTEGAP